MYLKKYATACLYILWQCFLQVVVRGADAWSIGELVHVLLIVASIRLMAVVVCGCGIAPEADLHLPDTEADKENNTKK